MAETLDKTEDSAEKAYAAAATTATDTAPVEAKPEPAAKAPVGKNAPVKAKTSKLAAKRAPAKAKKPAAKKPVAKKAAAKPAAKKTAPKKTITKSDGYKDRIMDMKKNLEGVQKMLSEAQDKAGVALVKGKAVAVEAGEFTKGNVEAVIESGKILADGVQAMGKDMIDETKTSIETVTADVKEIAAVKSPAEYLKVQGDIARKNFDHAIEVSTKNTEAFFKLATSTLRSKRFASSPPEPDHPVVVCQVGADLGERYSAKRGRMAFVVRPLRIFVTGIVRWQGLSSGRGLRYC